MRTCEYNFALVVDGFDVDDDAQVEALYAHGCDDATAENLGDKALVTFYREACSPEAALWSGINDLHTALPACRVLRVDDQLVNASDIAERLDRTPESIRQLASGSRGTGGFPAPAGVVGKGVKIWRWADVQPWLAQRGLAPDEATLPAPVIADANAQLARTPDEPLLAVAIGTSGRHPASPTYHLQGRRVTIVQPVAAEAAVIQSAYQITTGHQSDLVLGA